ncbi:hypothetical protein AA14337_3008 [Acetobacter malorum DSM 14337]|uniref:Tetratricopeptide repeat protein n=2 Tax=Acetobacter malorum TaxID=178901 RepID=A0ABQ0PZ47_9PROT|nr:hypothetical protein AA14337_3008 [Acetobacter malorum DSM 14337]
MTGKTSTARSPAAEAAIKAHRAKDMTEALRLYRSELELNPDDALILSNYGAALSETNDFQGSLTALKRAVRVAPEMADAWCNLGNTLTHLQDYRGAVQAYQQSVKLNGNHPLAISNLAFAIDQLGDNPALARKLHKMAVRLDPENEQTRTNNALSLLREGNYLEGFREYEWRWTTYRKRLGLTVPTWQGESMPGGTLFVTTEGGYGDMIQFCRFLPQAEIVSSGNVVLTARAELLSLLRHSFPTFTIIEEKGDIEPAHGQKSGMGQSLAQVSVMSLPFALGATIDSIPMAGGYLAPPPVVIAEWKKLQAEALLKEFGAEAEERLKKSLHIGLVWAGGAHSEVREAELANRRRSTDLSTFTKLAQYVPDSVFYSLQVGDKADQALSPPAKMRMIDLTGHIQDFSDTAGLIANLDVVVAVDTSTAHLAAAMGKPVIMLSRYDQCWRWLRGKVETPWYETMRIFQQPAPFDWSEPVNCAGRALKKMRKAKSQGKVLITC